MMSDDEIKKVFFSCEMDDPDSLYADDVDVIEFAKKLEEYIQSQFSTPKKNPLP